MGAFFVKSLMKGWSKVKTAPFFVDLCRVNKLA